MFLTKEQVELMDVDACEKQLQVIAKKFPLTKSLDKLTPEQFAQIDDIANNILWLEDHIAYTRRCEIAREAGKARWTGTE